MPEEGISMDGETVVSTVNIGTGETAKVGAEKPETKEVSSAFDNMNDDPNLGSTINPPPYMKEDEAGKKMVDKSTEESEKTEDKEKSEAEEKAKAEAKEETEEEVAPKTKTRIKNLLSKNKELEERAIRAEERAKVIEELGVKEKSKGKEPDYKDISLLSDDEISEWQDRDPKGWAANLLRQAKAELSDELGGTFDEKLGAIKTGTMEDQIENTYNEFAKSNEGFNDMWESGEIEDYMEKHPGHNAMSAFNALTSGKSKEAIQKRIDEGIKAGIEKHLKQQKVNRETASISGSTGVTRKETSTGDEELKDTSKFGGTVSAIANRLIKRRQAQTGT